MKNGILPIVLGVTAMTFVLLWPPCASADDINKPVLKILEIFEDGLRKNEFDEEKIRHGFADIIKEIRIQIEKDEADINK
jgi:hypothetical protein